jgi:hypothetical protein
LSDLIGELQSTFTTHEAWIDEIELAIDDINELIEAAK